MSAYWNGAVAYSTTVRNCWAIVLETNCRKESPTTMPLTPPEGFCKAVILPMRGVNNFFWDGSSCKLLSQVAEQNSISIVVQQKPQMFRRHPRQTRGGPPAGTPQILQHCLVIQLERNHRLMRLDFNKESLFFQSQMDESKPLEEIRT